MVTYRYFIRLQPHIIGLIRNKLFKRLRQSTGGRERYYPIETSGKKAS